MATNALIDSAESLEYVQHGQVRVILSISNVNVDEEADEEAVEEVDDDE